MNVRLRGGGGGEGTESFPHKTVTSWPKPKFLALIGYYIFLLMVLRARSFGARSSAMIVANYLMHPICCSRLIYNVNNA